MPASFQDIYVGLLALTTLFGMGLTLQPADLAEIMARRRGLLILAVAINLVALPLLGLALFPLFGAATSFAVGFMLCMAAPGGGTGTLLTYVANGDLRFSVALLLILTVSSVVITPSWMVLAAPADDVGQLYLAALPMAGILFGFILLPLVAGMTYRRLWPVAADVMQPWIARLSLILLLLLVVAYLVTHGHLVIASGWRLPLLTLIGVVAALASGWLVRQTAAPATVAAFSLTTSVRNITLAILLAATYYRDEGVLVAVLAYGLIMYLVGIPAAMLWARQSRNDATPAPMRDGAAG
jgi:bile acid:Na+ symporter, BASS family